MLLCRKMIKKLLDIHADGYCEVEISITFRYRIYNYNNNYTFLKVENKLRKTPKIAVGSVDLLSV